jgi:hypothetical protein
MKNVKIWANPLVQSACGVLMTNGRGAHVTQVTHALFASAT